MFFLNDYFEFFAIKSRSKAASSGAPFPEKILTGFTFNNVGFKYVNSEKWAVRNLNFNIHPNDQIAIVGENGSGKSTLVKLLLRLYDPSEGTIYLEGKNILEYNREEYFQKVSILFQDFGRYNLTAGLNIACGNIQHKDDHSVIRTAAKAGLADTIIEPLPAQYDQILGKVFANGVELSGGQWQRVGLSRAFMRKAALYVFDEPTSGLDPINEELVVSTILQHSRESMMIFVSHRLSAVRQARKIIVLKNGQVMEVGSHNELIESGKAYAALFKSQMESAKPLPEVDMDVVSNL
jgi:ATP-binding cassette subfamily B protein